MEDSVDGLDVQSTGRLHNDKTQDTNFGEQPNKEHHNDHHVDANVFPIREGIAESPFNPEGQPDIGEHITESSECDTEQKNKMNAYTKWTLPGLEVFHVQAEWDRVHGDFFVVV
ncbi:hypothetical protein WICPIJ_005561 [Wickerhamomyces pijperi]|uniref:Uncharacterized protein n=1 Tax=Wickerhamomyces pijperi TaxID=599730 RepID=A0A9P8Q3C6_WICPI|nr:hypothetical protein WICPIJ_005561 [Wickerhamomyces pijperi]